MKILMLFHDFDVIGLLFDDFDVIGSVIAILFIFSLMFKTDMSVSQQKIFNYEYKIAIK